MSNNGWIGVDFDGTLATYDGWKGASHCGEPIGAMVFRVKKWLADGREVRIFTARMWPITQVMRPDEPTGWVTTCARTEDALSAVDAIRAWCKEHVGEILPITCVKDYGMVCLYDDRCRQVMENTGAIVGEEGDHAK